MFTWLDNFQRIDKNQFPQSNGVSMSYKRNTLAFDFVKLARTPPKI